MTKKRIIFCDFDGTITVNDNIVAIMKHFKPGNWDELVDQVIHKKISIKEGVGRMFALLPASMKKEVVDYAISNVKIRDGFGDLLEYAKREDIHFLVTSGGIDFFVYPVLSSFSIPENHIYCNGSDFSGEHIRITWPHPCDDNCKNDCGMCKTTIMRSYPESEYHRILIGDSVTDFEGAKLADTVFARSHLIQMCEEIGMPYYAYETFFDVINRLEEMKVK